MDSDLLRLLEERWRLGEITVDDLHGVADHLLRSGEDSPPLIQLFGLDPSQLRWEAGDWRAAFEALLQEWGSGDMSLREAAEVVSLDMSLGVLEGRVAPDEAVWRVEAINVRTDFALDPLVEWNAFAEELSWNDSHPHLGRARADIEANVIELARSIVRRDS